MQYKDLLEKRYCIAVPNLYLQCMIFDIEKHSYGLINHTHPHTFIHIQRHSSLPRVHVF